ncbi:MAG: DUF6920 family protein [Calditrichia bacterium]
MKTVFTIIVALHGLIHLLGFVKAFKIAEVNDLTIPISKSSGVLRLIACVLFLITAILFASRSDYWWLVGILSVLLSQTLIVIYWQDAKYATLPNFLILLVCVGAYANFQFMNMVESEVFEMNAVRTTGQEAGTQQPENLPLPVKKWLSVSNIMSLGRIETVYLEQETFIKLKPNQKDWYSGTAKQYFTTQPPAFIWHVDLTMNPLIQVSGRDKYVNGKGEMLIKLFSLISVADAKENHKVDQGTLQRYLAEIAWFPSAALNPYIRWQPIDNRTAKATMSYNGVSGSGTFYFSKDGDLQKFIAMRYKEVDDESQPIEWVAEVLRTEEKNGVRVPTRMQATWQMESGAWTWLKLNITDIRYNIAKEPIVQRD